MWCRASARGCRIISTGRGASTKPRDGRLVFIGRKGLDRNAIAGALAGFGAVG